MNSTIPVAPVASQLAQDTEAALRNYREAVRYINTSYGSVSSAMSSVDEYRQPEEIVAGLEKMEEHLATIREAMETAERYAQEIANLVVIQNGLEELQSYNSARWDYYHQLRHTGGN